ncbi:MAG: hypothetical protein ACFCVC_03155 [Acidimicrobiia bacterium]
MKRLALFSTWLLATVAVSWVTYQVLDAADAEVRNGPQTAVVVAASREPQVVVVGAAAETGETEPRGSQAADPATPDGSSPVTMIAQDDQTDGVPATAGPTGTSPAPPSDGGGSGGGGATTTSTTVTTVPSATTATTALATTSTTAAQAWTTTTITSPGGNLTVSYRPGEVRYEVAVPAAGYELEIDSTGPDVKVEFEDDEGDGWEIRARWKDGAFSPEVEEW